MMSLSYIRQGTIYFVPVLRHHLNFAVLVQRALHDLQFDRRDLITVELPVSVQQSIVEAVQKLPTISLIISSVSDSDQHEVFPVTPADGIIEGIRTALDHEIPLEFIDQELPLGQLTNRFCIPDENWPDDALALEKGAEWYLDLIAERLSHSPSRYEPVDSWRELHMAMRLQQLYPFYRRILVICNAAHVRPIQQLLRQPPLVLEHDMSVVSGATHKIWKPSLPMLISYLDYIPQLVELYEKQRSQGEAHTFNKHTALMGLMYRLQEEATDMNFSIRHYQAFAQILTRMLEREGQISPRFETVLLACESCFNKPFKERVYRHLLGYYEQVKVMRIGKLVETKEPIYEIQQTNIEDIRRVFVARGCTQIEQYYEIVRVPSKDDDRQSNGTPTHPPDQPFRQFEIELNNPPRLKRLWNSIHSEWTVDTWPPYGQFANAMRRKVYNLAMHKRAKQEKSLEFQGSLHSGVDFRRTLRSYLTYDPKLYVKTARKSTGKLIDRNEPILWLFQTNVIDPKPLHYDTLGGPDSDNKFVMDWYSAENLVGYDDERSVVFDGTNSKNIRVKIQREKLLGILSFVDDLLLIDDIKAQFGSNFHERIPHENEGEFIDDNVGYMLHPEIFMNSENTSWGDYLLFGAIHYAKETVLVVSPTDFTIPYHAFKYAYTKGKDIVQISLSQFTTDEVRRLQIRYYTEHKYLQKEEAADPGYLAYLIENFSDVMGQFW